MFSPRYFDWKDSTSTETATANHVSIRLRIPIDRAGSGLAQPQEVPRDGGADRPAVGAEPGARAARSSARSTTLPARPKSSRMPTRSPATPARRPSSWPGRSRRWVIADDSGLAVDALDGAPGVFSARYAGEPSDDEANNRKLLEATGRTAR